MFFLTANCAGFMKCLIFFFLKKFDHIKSVNSEDICLQLEKQQLRFAQPAFILLIQACGLIHNAAYMVISLNNAMQCVQISHITDHFFKYKYSLMNI